MQNIKNVLETAVSTLNDVYQCDSKKFINIEMLAAKITSQLTNEITKKDFFDFISQICSYQSIDHYAYDNLASILQMMYYNEICCSDVLEYFLNLQKLKLIDDKYVEIVKINKDVLQKNMLFQNDFKFNFFGLRTLIKSYLLRDENQIIEKPQFMFLRVALQIHQDDIEKVIQTYKMMSNKEFVHATPTLFNSCARKPQLSSCFLVDMKKNSIEGIYETLKNCALISKHAAGLSVQVSQILSTEQNFDSQSSNIIQMLQVFNATSRYVNQGGKRKGSIAMFIEPYHIDIETFLQMKLNTGSEDTKARDLFYGLVIPSIFMERVKQKQQWTLFCSSDVANLKNLYGSQFTTAYEAYEKDNTIKNKRVVNAVDIWKQIVVSQIETGTPYILYKDSVNEMSNQKNIGTVHQSNLCVAPETFVLTDKGHVRISQLKDQQVNVWNGFEWSGVTVKQTNENQSKVKLVKVTTKNKMVLWCTLYHTFKIFQNDAVVDVKTHELKEGMQLVSFYQPVLSQYVCDLGKVVNEFGIFDGKQITINTTSTQDLQNIKMMTQLCGINSQIQNDAVILTEQNINILVSHCFKCKFDLQFSDEYSSQKCFDEILTVEDFNRFDDTYCFNEPKIHQGIFNGILTGQCMEIVQHTNKNETAVCTLGSISLSSCVENKVFNFEKLIQISEILTENLNNIIDLNYYPIKEAEFSQLRTRSIGIGVQGLADVFFKMDIAFSSQQALELNQKIFEHIYFGALKKSNELAKKHGPYETYDGSPFSQGLLQFDLYEKFSGKKVNLTLQEEFDELKKSIKQFGLRNSLLTALMPTASTSQIFGNTECFEPNTSNLYSRSVLSGSFICINRYLIDKLIELNKWTYRNQQILLRDNGSVQNIDISDDLKEQFKTVWEIKQKHLINMAIARQPFIDQSQSMNIYMPKPSYKEITAMHFYGFQNHLKTGLYYLRTKPAANPVKITLIDDENQLDQHIIYTKNDAKKEFVPQCEIIIDDDGNEMEVCINCSS